MRNKSPKFAAIDMDLDKLRTLSSEMLESDDPSDREFAMLANARLGLLESLVEAVATADRITRAKRNAMRAQMAMTGVALLSALTVAVFAITQLVKLLSGNPTTGLIGTIAVVTGGLALTELGFLAAKKLRRRWTRLSVACLQTADDYEATMAVYHGLR